jgi:hypothetical protein
MIDTPERFNTDSLSLAVCQEELSNVLKGEGNMLHNVSLLDLTVWGKGQTSKPQLSLSLFFREGIAATAMR